MTRVLLTGGSGFIAAHVLDLLLEHGHSVITTVRSEEKAQKIREAHPDHGKEKLDFSIVEDIAQPGAFDKAVISDPPFETVIHTASPFHFNITDTKKDLLDPAIIGTTGILQAIKKSAPAVTRVVITSSFAAIVNKNPSSKDYTYSEKDWNPITEKEAYESSSDGYRASKTFAERAAWDFVEKEKPNFSLVTVNPPLVLGPVVHYLNSLSALNTSNQRIRDMIQGVTKEKLTPSGVYFWIDVRDLATAHVEAAERKEAAGQRFFTTAGYFSNRDIAEIIREKYPNLREKVAGTEEALSPGGYPPKEELAKYNNSRAKEVLGLKFRSLKESVVDTVESLLEVEDK